MKKSLLSCAGYLSRVRQQAYFSATSAFVYRNSYF